METDSLLRVAVCQMTSVDDAEANLRQIQSLLESAQGQGEACVLAFFPENCLYMRIKEGERIVGISLQDEVILRAEQLAKKFRIDLHFGSLPLRVDGKLYNSSVFIPAGGSARATYQKVHLFDISLEGQAPIRESDVFDHGTGMQVLESHNWSFGQTICYDIRFAELFHQYAKKHVDVILVPAAFLVATGQAHWEVLLRARAIESQAYVIAAAQAESHYGIGGGQRETYGRSLVVDPWGKILWEATSMGPEAKVLDLSRAKIDQVRKQIPMKNHRRI